MNCDSKSQRVVTERRRVDHRARIGMVRQLSS